jgi:hypothetical protein
MTQNVKEPSCQALPAGISPQFIMSPPDTPNHEKTHIRMGGAKRNPSAFSQQEKVGSALENGN